MGQGQSEQVADLQSVITTELLSWRPARVPNYEAESAALLALAQEMSSSPALILQRLAEAALELCQAGSAGVSILEEEDGEKIFRWRALAGAMARHIEGTTPRDFSPCGVVLDRNAPQLISEPQRCFTYFATVEPRITEALFVPFHVGGVPVGAVWVAAHDQRCQFDAEDGRLIADLAKFASAAYQMLNALAAAKEADRRKDEFLATLAHELRNPLAPMYNAVFYLGREGATPENEKQARGVLQRQLKHMTRLIDDLSDAARINRRQLALKTERLDVRAIVQSAIEASRPLIDASRHALTVTLPEKPLYVEADATRLAQVITNLLNNATKYTPEGGHLCVAVEREARTVAIRVRDDGVGIAPEILPRLFEMYMQVDSSLGRARGGLGIGLSLARTLMRLHGGTVEAYSAGRGLGSEFVVRLPRHQVPPVRATEPAKRADTPRRLRILVVDDNRDAADSLAVLLRLHKHDVRIRYDGISALAVGAEYRPQVVVLDLGMPSMSGYELASRLRALPGGKDVLIIALSGYGRANDQRRSREAGCDHHMLKPVNMEELERFFKAARTDAVGSPE
ncbi:MAG: ATP-binding protein [Sulfurifustis sp.]